MSPWPDRNLGLSLVMRTLPAGVWVMNEQGQICRYNPAGRRIWCGARLVGPDQFGEYKGWWADTGRRIEPEEWAAARVFKTGETSTDELIHIECFDGSHKTILNSAAPLRDETGAIVGGLIVNQDVTHLKRIEPGAGRGALHGDLAVRELTHRTKNGLQLIASFLDLQAAAMPDDSRGPLVEAAMRIQAVARIQDLLGGEENGVVRLDLLAQQLCGELAKLLPAASGGIEVQSDRISWPAQRALTLAMILSELVMNAIKHALPRGGRSVRVSLRDLDDGLALAVADDGPGLPVDLEHGFGMRIVDRLVAQLGGSLSARSQHGARYIVRVPKTAATA